MPHHVQLTQTCPDDFRRTICVFLACPESESVSTLTAVQGNHEVTEWHLRTETTHDHAVHEFQVSLQVSNKYFIFKFWVFNRVVSTTYVTSITLQLTSMSAVMMYPTSMWRKVMLQMLDMRSGDFTNCCRCRLSRGNLQGHTSWVLMWIPTRATSSEANNFSESLAPIVDQLKLCEAQFQKNNAVCLFEFLKTWH